MARAPDKHQTLSESAIYVAECYDPPSPGPPVTELVEVRSGEPGDGTDLRRADDRSAGSAGYDKKAAFWAASDSVAVYRRMN